jgi:hypothetical protein
MAITWDAGFLTSPSGAAAGSTLDTVIQQFKEAVNERLLKEHVLGTSVALDGLHLAGSAQAYYQSGIVQTNRPDAVALTARDYGRLLVDSAAVATLAKAPAYVYTASGWVPVSAEWQGSALTISTSDASGGANDDIWFKVAT